MSEPLKVSISPKAMSTLWWISATGGVMNPANNSIAPNPHRITDNISCNFFIILLSFSPQNPPRDVLSRGRAEALGAFNPPGGFCAPQQPNARTKVHNATDNISCILCMAGQRFSLHTLPIPCWRGSGRRSYTSTELHMLLGQLAYGLDPAYVRGWKPLPMWT